MLLRISLHFSSKLGKYTRTILLRSSKNAFIMQSKSTFLEFFDVYSLLQICPPPPPKNSSGAKFIQGEWCNFHRAHALFAGVKFHVLPRVLVCFLVEFDYLFEISVLSCRILDCASLFIYVHEHDCLCFPMLTVVTAVFFLNINNNNFIKLFSNWKLNTNLM